MRALSTPAQARRAEAFVLLGAGFAALVVSWNLSAWWLSRPGHPVERVLGLTLPPGSRLVFVEGLAWQPSRGAESHRARGTGERGATEHDAVASGAGAPDAAAHADDLPEAEGPHDPVFAAFFVSTPWSVEEATRHLRERATRRYERSRRFVLEDGAMVLVARAGEVPATLLPPFRLVAPRAPVGTRSWLVISRGAPPSGTSMVGTSMAGTSTAEAGPRAAAGPRYAPSPPGTPARERPARPRVSSPAQRRPRPRP